MAAKSRIAQRAGVPSVDPIWAALRTEAEEVARNEPALGGFIYATVLSHPGWRMRCAIGWPSVSTIRMWMPG